MHLLCPPWTEQPAAHWFKAALPRAAHVYPNHAQSWLTMKALREGGFTMPDDARRLIEGVFGDEAEVPAGLQANAQAAEGSGYAAQAQAMSNTLGLAQGYTRAQSGGVDWWGDAHTPSRLGEATTTVALARWDGQVLRPWVDGPHGWAYSSLRMAERAISAEAEFGAPALQAAVDAARDGMPGQGRWAVLLPMRQTDCAWIGEALPAAPRSGTVRPRPWRYDTARGLEPWRPPSKGKDPERERKNHEPAARPVAAGARRRG